MTEEIFKSKSATASELPFGKKQFIVIDGLSRRPICFFKEAGCECEFKLETRPIGGKKYVSVSF